MESKLYITFITLMIGLTLIAMPVIGLACLFGLIPQQIFLGAEVSLAVYLVILVLIRAIYNIVVGEF